MPRTSKHMTSEPPGSLPYECELCGATEDIPMEVIDHFDKVDPGLPGQPPTFGCEQCPGIMYPVSYLRAERAEPKAS
jgi:uncharacterized Zn finger protein